MTSQIRVDEITNRSGLGTVTIYDNGFEFTGVTTFTEDVDITGGLTIGGVLTYEDVTNIDSVGVITARAGINISGGNLQVDGTTVINSGRALYNLEQIKLADTKELVLGSNDDLKIYHSGSHSFISEEGAGALKIKGDDIRFETASGTAFVNTTSAGQITVGGAVFNYQGTSKPYNNNAGTLWGTANIALTGQWSSINWPSDHSDPEPSQPWYMMGRPHGSTDNWALSIRPGSSNALYDIIECDNDSNGYISNLKFHTSNGQERLRITSAGIHKISTAGNTQDGTFYSTLTLNNTGSNTFSRVRFDRSGVARFGLTLRNDDKLCISNLYQGGSVTANDAAFVMDANSKIGINEASPTARLDINHPNTEQGLVVRSRYGNINTAMVKFDGDPDSDGGDGNVLHLHGGSSRTDSEILHIDSTGVGDIFDIRGDGLTRVYKQLQLEHSSNVAKIIFNEYGANDIKAQIEMDQVNGSSGQLIFRTQDSGTLSEKVRITSDGKVGFNNTPDEKLHLDGAIKQDGATNGVKYTQMCFTLPSGSTSTMFTLSGSSNDATAMAVLEYVALYAYGGSSHEAGIRYASTRRANNNSAWNDIDNVAVNDAGNNSGIRPNIFWDNGVLKITTGTHVQITGTLRLTTRTFTVTRNYNAG